MEVTYRKRFNQSYMIVREESDFDEVYELVVLTHNRIPGLLKVETEIADGDIRFWYDITGRQSLKDYLERRQVDSNLLLLLFTGVENLCKELAEYLLEEGNVVLEPEYLYLDFDHTTLEFVYLPGWQRDIRESFQELMEVILRRLKHSDKRATTMAYEMYQLSLQREESFFKMLQRVATVKEEQEKCRENSKQQWESTSEKEDGVGRDTRENGEACLERENLLKSKINLHLPGQIKRLVSGLREEHLPWKKQLQGYNRVEMTSCYVTQEEEIAYPTEILSTERRAQGLLKYQGKHELADIYVEKPIFVIGKNEKEVDGIIGSKSISRVHARLELSEGIYYIEDLNSTNGTWLNGESLEYKEKQPIEPGDRIAFGEEEYIFM